YGDGMLTPAISVLSAVEGLREGGPQFEPAIMPLALIILVGLFVLQSRGTDRIGKLVWGGVVCCFFPGRRPGLGGDPEAPGNPKRRHPRLCRRAVRGQAVDRV